jgi:hypothetical protein
MSLSLDCVSLLYGAILLDQNPSANSSALCPLLPAHPAHQFSSVLFLSHAREPTIAHTFHTLKIFRFMERPVPLLAVAHCMK